MNPYFKRKILDHLWGPTGSILLHIVVFFIAVQFVQFAVRDQAPEVEVMIMEPDAVDIEELEELKQEIEDLELPDVQVNVDVYVDAPVPEDVTEFQAEEPDVNFDALDVMDNMNSPLVMRGLFSGRSAGGRAKMLNAYGGKHARATEFSVIRALEWLKDNQNPDGSWNKTKPAMTGLALLTFLAHGETPGSDDYGDTVRKGLRYLVDTQAKNGQWSREYAHAIATYAVSEAYGLTRIPELKDAMEKGLAIILNGQQEGGGWDYGYKKGDRRDTSVVGWQLQALKAGYLAGAENPGIKEAMAKSAKDLLSVYNAEIGSFGYTGRGGANATMTGVGTLCLQLLGYGKEQEVKKALELLKAHTQVKWDEPKPHAALYGWYYITQAMFHHGGRTWSTWNNEFAPVITSNQNEDGSWGYPMVPGGTAEHGSNEGAVFSTTLSALMLQVYYRNLPTFQEKAVDEEIIVEDKDEIVIEVI